MEPDTSIRRFRVYGTPTDCVHVAITGMLEEEPDIVVPVSTPLRTWAMTSFIPGTVAAAMEGRFLGLPAVAVSLGHARPRRAALRDRRTRRRGNHRAPGGGPAARRHRS
jgi:5'/3'-nucleotidase SurE